MLAGCVDTGVRVLAVGRDRPPIPPEGRGDQGGGLVPFRLLVCDRFGLEEVDRADVAPHAGTYGNARWTGPGGVPAPGEVGIRQLIWYAVPDVLGRTGPSSPTGTRC